MVLGVSAKDRKNGSVRVNYLIHIQEIKPWPPSQSLRSLRSVLIQWANGDRSSGSTTTVVPSPGSIVGEGKIEFNESFRLSVMLLRENSSKGKDTDTFQKNCLEFNLCEPRRDKTQLLATAVVDLADYGVVKETISASAPMNSKRSFRNTSDPVLYIKIQPVDKKCTGSSSRESLSKGVSLDKNGGESVSALINEEYAEEAEIASFSDDDISSHSSLNNGSLPPQKEENGRDGLTESKGSINGEHAVALKQGIELTNSTIKIRGDTHQNIKEHTPSFFPAKVAPSDNSSWVAENLGSTNYGDLQVNEEESEEPQRAGKNPMEDTATNDDIYNNYREHMIRKKHQEQEHNIQHLEEKKLSSEDEVRHVFPQHATQNEISHGSETLALSEGIEMKGNTHKIDRLKPVKSVRSSLDLVRTNGLTSGNHLNEVKEVGLLGDTNGGNLRVNERKNAKVHPKDTRRTVLDNKIQQLEQKMKVLEGELREAAAIESALYSIVAEHGSSMSKVHAPARRLSRLYLHACGESSSSRRASAARSAVSGLVLVAKACGSDVPRLTFWLSNSVVLRAIISQAIRDLGLPLSAGPRKEMNGGGGGEGNKMRSTSLKWKELSPSGKENKNVVYGDFANWEDPHTFTSALERVEAWIFSRTIESIWWQTLTPLMQPAATKVVDGFIGSGSKKNLGRTSSSSDQDRGNLSLDLWKKAFNDACERLCPIRAGGHECGCLPALARLIMEQCVARLDVAMFNAILRESDDKIPTDPVSDPINDSRVLPIPAGKASFGAGAQLKNAIGNWSRWLTDLFGMDDDDSLEDDLKDENDERQDTSFKSFHFLNALSDLMMLPKDMLLSRSIRKEVCPTFGAPLIKRVLDNFVTDEFCPDPIPNVVLEALDFEDATEAAEDSVTTIPCIAAPPIYSPPLAASIAGIIGEFGSQSQLSRSGSSVLRKSYTSDDELDELNSPLSSIFLDGSISTSPTLLTKPSWKSKKKGNLHAIRYELLREVWMNSE